MPSIRKRAALQRDVFNALQRDVFNALQRDVFKKTDVSGRVLRFSFAYFDHSDGELCPAAGQQEGKLFLPQMYADRPNPKHGPAGHLEYLRTSAYIRGKKTLRGARDG